VLGSAYCTEILFKLKGFMKLAVLACDITFLKFDEQKLGAKNITHICAQHKFWM